MYIKKLIGEKCYLSPMDVEDAEQYALWLNDNEVTNYMQLATEVISIEEEKDIIRKLSKTHNYAIIDRQDNTLIGSTGLSSIDVIHRNAEIGIFIGDKNYWNKGYGREALSLLINYAYKKLNIHTIFLRTYSFNERAIACYEKIGFKKIGEIRENIIRDLEYHNTILMDILPREFYEHNPRYK